MQKTPSLTTIRFACAGAASLLAAMGGLFPLAVGAQSVAVPTAIVGFSESGARYTLDGVVQAVKQSTLAAQASGRIATLVVKAGDKVRAGQVVATIDDREAQVGLQQSQAQINGADAALRNARANRDRTIELQSKGFVSQSAMDTAELQYKSAVAQKDQAQAAGRQAGISQGFTRVTAPFDGWVLQTWADAGDLAVPGKPLVTVYAPQPLRAVVQVPASRNQAVRSAASTHVWVGGLGVSERAITPLSRTEIPSSDPVSQTSEWRMDLPAEGTATLVPGQQIRVQFDLPQASPSTRLRVPSAAVVRRGELTAVYVATAQGFALRAVRLGNVADTHSVEVLAGLHNGDVVALDPLRAAQPGAQAAKAQ